MRSLWSLAIIVITTLAVLPDAVAQPGSGMTCPGCQVSFATAQDLVEVISDVAGADPAAVVVEPGDAPGSFLVTLPGDSLFSVAPLGPVFRHQNMVQRRLLQSGEGGLRLRSQSRAELQLHGAIHREAAVIAEMLRLGWTDFQWLRHGVEAESPDGDRYCLQPDMEVVSQTPVSGIQINRDGDGYFVVRHPDGIRQRLHACAHDILQLQDRVREQLQQSLVIAIDGTFTLVINGEPERFRLASMLQWSNSTGQPGLITEGDRIHLRSRDGWQQEIVRID